MRIVAGLYKGRELKMPKGIKIRPTQDRVRESVFEIIKDSLLDADVLELFAGSGAMGIEALSRQAKSVIFVEKDPRCIKTIEENLDHVGIKDVVVVDYGLSHRKIDHYKQPQVTVIQADIFKALLHFNETKSKFEIIIADPPYGTDHARKILIKLAMYDILKKPFIVVIEHSEKDKLPDKEGNVILLKQYTYGATVLSIYLKESGHE